VGPGDRLRDPARRGRAIRPLLEAIEGRLMLSVAPSTMAPFAIRLGPPSASPGASAPDGTASPSAYTPAQFRHAYGFDQVSYSGLLGDGRGQTIAIVDAYDDPNIRGDLAAFDAQFGLPAPPSFAVVAQDGSNNLPGTDPVGPGKNNWEVEEALDVEWAHAMAPGADLLLVETNDNNDGNLYAGVSFAANQPGVSVVSMSWGRGEFGGENGNDGTLTTPGGHQGVTFVAASGDGGTISYPAASPNVLGVGGTFVNLDGGNNISSETAWSGSGGGVSAYEGLPGYQSGAVPGGTTGRASPDVAYNAGYGVSVYDSYNNGYVTPWSSIGGTSAGAPQWSALIAIANQGRALYGLPTLDGPSQTLPMIYSASSLDFNDITSGSNKGYSAGPGYDMVTGLGSPKADLVAYSLIGQNFYLSNGVLTVNGDQLGDNYNDTVILNLTGSGGVQATLNGMTAQFNPGDVTSIDVITKGGDNTVNIEATAAGVPVSLSMLGGTGTVNITPIPEDMYNIQGNVYLTGGSAADVLNIYDAFNESDQTYSVTSSTVTRTGAAPITYNSMGQVNVYGSQGNDTWNIDSTKQGTPVTVYGGAGDETFNVTPSTGNLGNIQSNLRIDAGDAGSSTLNVDDVNNKAASTWTLASKSVQQGLIATNYDTVARSGWGYEIDFEAPIRGLDFGTNTEVIKGGSGNNTYNIEGTAPATTLTVQGGSGNDICNISPTAQNLDNIQGNVAIDGGLGANALRVYDGNNGKAVTYSVTSSTVTRTGAATISYDSLVGSMTLDGGAANDTYDIESTSAHTPVTVSGGAGNDTFNVSPTAKDLGTIQGGLSIAGFGGSNHVNLFDQADAKAVTYSVTSSTVTRTGAAPISYTSVSSLTLDGGKGGDIYNIESTSASTPVTVAGEAGNDTFNVSPTARSLGTIQGNLTILDFGGNNNLVLDDQANAAGTTYSLTSSTVTRAGAAPISYSSMNSLVLNGGSGNDTYSVNGTAVGIKMSLDAGKGNDTFDVIGTAPTSSVSVNGGAGTNTLVGPNVASTWKITGANAGTIGNVTFAAVQDLTGGSANDTFQFAPGGSVSGKVVGGGGTNTLDYSGDGGAAATINLAASTATRTGGFANIENLVGSTSSADKLIGPNTTNTWSINANNGGTVDSFHFSGIENLTGGSGLDVFVFAAGKSVSGKIDGGGGGSDWIDYAAYTTPVAVNLATGTATGVGGIANIRNVRGGQGGDTLTGDAQGNVLIGGAGTNTIVGGTGRSILIGGKGKDTITGHSGGDILIAGYTDYDPSSLANDLALDSILAEWQSAKSYATRISDIKNGGGLNGSKKLVWGTTVHDNAVSNANKLTGGGGASGQNWFFANVSHTKTNKTAGEQLN
jgi:hypothetical protein